MEQKLNILKKFLPKLKKLELENARRKKLYTKKNEKTYELAKKEKQNKDEQSDFEYMQDTFLENTSEIKIYNDYSTPASTSEIPVFTKENTFLLRENSNVLSPVLVFVDTDEKKIMYFEPIEWEEEVDILTYTDEILEKKERDELLGILEKVTGQEVGTGMTTDRILEEIKNERTEEAQLRLQKEKINKNEKNETCIFFSTFRNQYKRKKGRRIKERSSKISTNS